MSISRTGALALIGIACISIGLKQVKYANDRMIWEKGADIALKALLHDNGYAAQSWELTHGGFAGSYRFTRDGCESLLVLSLRNSEDGVVSAYRQHIQRHSPKPEAAPVYVIEGRFYDQIPYLQLYYSLLRDEGRRLLNLSRYPASFMVYPDLRTLPPPCQLVLDWKTYRV